MPEWLRRLLEALGLRPKPPQTPPVTPPVPPVTPPAPVEIIPWQVEVSHRVARIPNAEVSIVGDFNGRKETNVIGWCEFLIPKTANAITLKVKAPGFLDYVDHGTKEWTKLARQAGRQAPNNPVQVQLMPVRPPVTAPELSRAGKTIQSRGKIWVPGGVSMLTAAAPGHADDEVEKFVAHVAGMGFLLVRVFLGALKEIPNPKFHQTAAQARQRLPWLLDLTKRYGVALDAVLLTDTKRGGYDAEEHVRLCAAILRGQKHVIVTLENEVGHSTQDPAITYETLRRWGAQYFDGMLWGCGAPEYGYDVPADSPHPLAGRHLDRDEPWPIDPYDVNTRDKFEGRGGPVQMAHLDRDRDFWDNGRREREIFACSETEDCPTVSAEPRRDIADPAWYALQGLLHRSFSSGGGVHHCAWGIEIRLPNADEQKRADAYMAGWNLADKILGGGRGFYRNAGSQDAPVARYSNEVFDAQVVRHYSFVNEQNNRAVSPIIGLKGSVTPPWINNFTPVGPPAGEWTAGPEGDGRKLQVWEVTR